MGFSAQRTPCTPSTLPAEQRQPSTHAVLTKVDSMNFMLTRCSDSTA